MSDRSGCRSDLIHALAESMYAALFAGTLDQTSAEVRAAWQGRAAETLRWLEMNGVTLIPGRLL